MTQAASSPILGTNGALTQPQQRVLEVIRNHIASRGFSPTRAEIAQQMGWRSANAAEEVVQRLSQKGVIRLSKGTARGITLVEAPAAPNEYLITPSNVLGADSFHVQAHSDEEAIAKAKERIARAEWCSPMGWEVYRKCKGFED